MNVSHTFEDQKSSECLVNRHNTTFRSVIRITPGSLWDRETWDHLSSEVNQVTTSFPGNHSYFGWFLHQKFITKGSYSDRDTIRKVDVIEQYFLIMGVNNYVFDLEFLKFTDGFQWDDLRLSTKFGPDGLRGWFRYLWAKLNLPDSNLGSRRGDSSVYWSSFTEGN